MNHGLTERAAPPRPSPGADPLALFSSWYDLAASAGERADVVALATCGSRGPCVRMVLVKGLSDGVLRVFTSYSSRKAKELEASGRAALAYHWPLIGAQVRIEGSVSRTSEAVSDAYFQGRPRGSQLSAVVSPQSQTITSLEELSLQRAALADSLGEATVSRPPSWGGYEITPDLFEFWLEGANRFHERYLFELGRARGWSLRLLAP